MYVVMSHSRLARDQEHSQQSDCWFEEVELAAALSVPLPHEWMPALLCRPDSFLLVAWSHNAGLESSVFGQPEQTLE